jgi:hypothetical protein
MHLQKCAFSQTTYLYMTLQMPKAVLGSNPKGSEAKCCASTRPPLAQTAELSGILMSLSALNAHF